MAVHAPITGAPTRAPAFPRSLRQRETIETEIEMHLRRVDLLLARLDRADAAFEDLEDDDPSGDSLDERGEAPTDNGSEMLRMFPMYAVDQSNGPTNEAAACKARYRALWGRP